MTAHENSVYGIKRMSFKANSIKDSAKAVEFLSDLVRSSKKQYEKILFLCIGTDKVVGDSYGPAVGSLINKVKGVEVLGVLGDTVNALNLKTTLDGIDNENTLVIAVDAALGAKENVGKITIAEGKIKPGAGVNKELPEVGDITITGVTGDDSTFSAFLTIHMADKKLIDILSRKTASIIRKVAKACEYQESEYKEKAQA